MLCFEARHEMEDLFVEALAKEGKELGAKLGISATMVSQVKNHRSPMTAKIAQKLCELMNQPELFKRWEQEKSESKARFSDIKDRNDKKRNARIDSIVHDLEDLSDDSLREIHEFILAKVNKQKKERRMRGVNWRFDGSLRALSSVSNDDFERVCNQDDSSTLMDCICRFGAEWINQYVDFDVDDLELYGRKEKTLNKGIRAILDVAVAGYNQKGKQENARLHE